VVSFVLDAGLLTSGRVSTTDGRAHTDVKANLLHPDYIIIPQTFSLYAIISNWLGEDIIIRSSIPMRAGAI